MTRRWPSRWSGASGTTKTPEIVTILPPREGFSPGAVGAIGLLVHRMARATGAAVIGRPVERPFADVAFHPAPPGFGLSRLARYAGGVARVVRRLNPRLIEVYNRPELARRLRRRGGPAVVLVLQNDPIGMRGATTQRERARLLGEMATVVCASAWIRDRLLEGVTPARPPTVLHNYIDVPPAPATEREALILFAGRVVADKGVDRFVQACAAVLPGLPGWRAEIIGADRFNPDSPDTPFIAALRPAAAAAGIAMLGYQPHAAIMARMAQAAIVVVPSRWPEPFGMVALEAMAQGAALVCSPRGGLPEVGGDAALYADPDTPGALEHAIAALAHDPAARAALAAAGHARARLFDTAQAAAALTALRAAILA